MRIAAGVDADQLAHVDHGAPGRGARGQELRRPRVIAGAVHDRDSRGREQAAVAGGRLVVVRVGGGVRHDALDADPRAAELRRDAPPEALGRHDLDPPALAAARVLPAAGEHHGQHEDGDPPGACEHVPHDPASRQAPQSPEKRRRCPVIAKPVARSTCTRAGSTGQPGTAATAPHESQRTCSCWPWTGSKRAFPSPRSTRATRPSRSQCASARKTDEKSADTSRECSSSRTSRIDQSWRELPVRTSLTASRTWLGRSMVGQWYYKLLAKWLPP